MGKEFFAFKFLNAPLGKLCEVLEEKHIKYDYDRIGKTIRDHSLGAALSAIAAGAVPAVGVPACVAICFGFTWSMYFRLAKEVGLSATKSTMKIISRGVLSNLASNAACVVALLAAETLSLIPVVGQTLAAFTSGAVVASCCIYAAYLFLFLLSKILGDNKKLSDYTVEELTKVLDNIYVREKDNIDLETCIKEAKEAIKTEKPDKNFKSENDDE